MDGADRGGDLAAPTPVPRETLAQLVGDACRLDDLLADIGAELRGRLYEIVRVAGGWQFRTRPRHAAALRGLTGAKDAGPPEFSALAAIAYLQPVTRGAASRFVGREISRDVIAAGPSAPAPGAPIAWVTTKRFLEMFAFDSLRDLPDLETREADGSRRATSDSDIEAALDKALQLDAGECEDDAREAPEFDETEIDSRGRGRGR